MYPTIFASTRSHGQYYIIFEDKNEMKTTRLNIQRASCIIYYHIVTFEYVGFKIISHLSYYTISEAISTIGLTE